VFFFLKQRGGSQTGGLAPYPQNFDFFADATDCLLQTAFLRLVPARDPWLADAYRSG